MRTIILAATLLLTQTAFAVDEELLSPPPPLPEIDTLEEADELQPEITIRRQKDATIEEYRVNGRLYMLKITPRRGYPYYLIDSDGDGQFETRRNELDPPKINQWILFRW
ncbi:MAG: DUF2782 domain-containing protein [Thiohalomonadaceae bacterium]|jgi:hypothetical protein